MNATFEIILLGLLLNAVFTTVTVTIRFLICLTKNLYPVKRKKKVYKK